MRATLAHARTAIPLALALLCASCDTLSGISDRVVGPPAPPVGEEGHVKGFLGGVVADEPHAAVVGRQVLSEGGTAADAAVAIGFTLAATLPSRAGIGGGGACLAYASDPKSISGGVPEAILFTPLPPANPGADADRPAAVPMMARGLYLLHARYGRRPFESLLVSAERYARLGVPVSQALAADLSVVSGPLFADPTARALFSHDGLPLKNGDTMVQPGLAATLAQIRVAGVGDFYQGALARQLAQQSPQVGGPITVAELRAALPHLGVPLIEPAGNEKVAFLPPPADGGLAAAAAFLTLRQHPTDLAGATARALAVAARWRAGGITPQAVLDAPSLPAAVATLPASTTFATLDRDGNAVVCAVSLGNLFGTGRVVPGLGFLLAASPAAVPPPLYSAALAWNDHIHSFRAEVGGSGQASAPIAVAVGMVNTLGSGRAMPVPVPDPGRTNVIACNSYLPGNEQSCAWATDPRGAGLALGGN